MDLLCKHQNNHTQAWYLFLVGMKWFSLRCDLLVTAFTAAVSFVSIPLRDCKFGLLIEIVPFTCTNIIISYSCESKFNRTRSHIFHHTSK